MVSVADIPRIEGQRTHLGRRAVIGLALLAVLVSVVSLGQGAAGLGTGRAISALIGGAAADVTDRIVMVQIRLPRVLAGLMVGASLAVAGALMQGLFRNPLADPGLLGVSAGASLGAIGAIVLGGTLPVALQQVMGWYLVPVAAFCGGWIAMMVLYRIATRAGRTSVATMLLAGIALGAMISALSGIIIYRADDSQLRDLTFWGLGSLAGASWVKLAACAPVMLVALAAAMTLPRGLNAIAMGEAVAGHIGVNVQRVKMVAVLSTAALAGAAVAMAGGIGFVGIVAPHLLRLMIGPDHRWLLPASALLGGVMLVAADIVSRTIITPAELPIGILTAMIGGPFFLYILLSNRRVVDL
ncbi:MAG: iron ABC transporter permease [Paracoccus sp. (in: a-proteobacteria)]|nr:iron ABC transporter permease [Paracoccus sp. (in: a-proteobacteria)]